jgi:hypothetical protein
VSPARAADARRAWERAYQLGLSKQDPYLRWTSFEASQEDWARMSEAAIKGVTRCGEDKYDLLQRAGYAESRLGQAQAKALDRVTAEQTLIRAKETLRRALRSAESVNAPDYARSKIFKALVVNGQAMRRGDEIVYWMKRWMNWKPDDPSALSECHRQATQYTELKALLQSEAGPS